MDDRPIPRLRLEDFSEELVDENADWLRHSRSKSQMNGVQNIASIRNGYLVRIGVDHAYGFWNAPVNPNTGEFVYVPIPDGATKEYACPNPRTFSELGPILAEFSERTSAARISLPAHLRSLVMHLDPDFEHLTYGDNGSRRAAGISALAADDLLVFYSGMRSIIKPYPLIYAIVGLYVVDEVARADSIPDAERLKNAHTRWKVVSPNDIVVRARPSQSGRLRRCLPIGEWRERAYRITKEIETSWGGLSVKNGFIQRSAVPPRFLDADRFYRWFQEQDVELLNRNN